MTTADDLAFHLSHLLKSAPADHAKTVLAYLDPENVALAPAWLRGLADALELEAKSDDLVAPTISAILDERRDLESQSLEPCRVIAELDTLSTLRIEARGPFEYMITSDQNGGFRFQELPLTLVARADVPARGWTILTRR